MKGTPAMTAPSPQPSPARGEGANDSLREFHARKHDFVEGKTEALSVGEAPDRVVKMALRAARLIGDGFYGVDIKEVGKRLYVIEINDNPNIDAGNEDSVLKDALYREVMGVFLKRIEARKRGAAR